MSEVTIRQLAKVLDMRVDKLMGQLIEAGIKYDDINQVISNTDKKAIT